MYNSINMDQQTFVVNLDLGLCIADSEKNYVLFVDSVKMPVVLDFLKHIQSLFSIVEPIRLQYQNCIIHWLEDIRILKNLRNIEVVKGITGVTQAMSVVNSSTKDMNVATPSTSKNLEVRQANTSSFKNDDIIAGKKGDPNQTPVTYSSYSLLTHSRNISQQANNINNRQNLRSKFNAMNNFNATPKLNKDQKDETKVNAKKPIDSSNNIERAKTGLVGNSQKVLRNDQNMCDDIAMEEDNDSSEEVVETPNTNEVHLNETPNELGTTVENSNDGNNKKKKAKSQHRSMSVGHVLELLRSSDHKGSQTIAQEDERPEGSQNLSIFAVGSEDPIPTSISVQKRKRKRKHKSKKKSRSIDSTPDAAQVQSQTVRACPPENSQRNSHLRFSSSESEGEHTEIAVANLVQPIQKSNGLRKNMPQSDGFVEINMILSTTPRPENPSHEDSIQVQEVVNPEPVAETVEHAATNGTPRLSTPGRKPPEGSSRIFDALLSIDKPVVFDNTKK